MITENEILNFIDTPVGAIFFLAFLTWSTIWKGLALWRSAKKDDSLWFVILLVFNTAGLLEILYYFVISKRKKKK